MSTIPTTFKRQMRTQRRKRKIRNKVLNRKNPVRKRLKELKKKNPKVYNRYKIVTKGKSSKLVKKSFGERIRQKRVGRKLGQQSARLKR